MTPRYSNDETFHLPLIPVGEWKFEFRFSKMVNNSEKFLLSYALFYEIKPRGAEEF